MCSESSSWNCPGQIESWLRVETPGFPLWTMVSLWSPCYQIFFYAVPDTVQSTIHYIGTTTCRHIELCQNLQYLLPPACLTKVHQKPCSTLYKQLSVIVIVMEWVRKSAGEILHQQNQTWLRLVCDFWKVQCSSALSLDESRCVYKLLNLFDSGRQLDSPLHH